MLRLHRPRHLEQRLGVSLTELEAIASKIEDFCVEYELVDPSKPEKRRRVLDVTGALRSVQKRIYQRLLLPNLVPSICSHGGVRGRSVKTNISAHAGSVYVYNLDVTDFYPSITNNRVNRLFLNRFQCHPTVAHLCTRLCTYQYHLALGMITSPILADQVMRSIDDRIAAACKREGLVYTRFVDDIAISGTFALDNSGFPNLVKRILREHGFTSNRTKDRHGLLSECPVTGVRIRNGHPDIAAEFQQRLEDQLRDADRLARGRGQVGEFVSKAQIRGRIAFACWVCPSRRKPLMRWFHSIDWNRFHDEAMSRGLMVRRSKLSRLIPAKTSPNAPAARGLAEADLTRAYRTQVDPRLNYEQALEMAMIIARRV